MKRFFEKLSLKNQYLLFYIALLLMPALIFSSGLLLSYREIRSQVMDANYSSLEQTALSVETAVSSLSELTAIIEKDSTLTRYALRNSPYEAIAMLDKLRSSNNAVTSIILHAKGGDAFYSSAGAFKASDMSIQAYIKSVSVEANDITEVMGYFEDLEKTLYYTGHSDLQGSGSYLFIFTPVAVSKTDIRYASRNVVYLISQAYLQEIFLSSQTEDREMVMLLNEDLQLLSHSSCSGTDLDAGKLREIVEYLKNHSEKSSGQVLFREDASEGRSGNRTLRYGKYMIFSRTSSETGLTYLRVLNRRQAFVVLYRLSVFAVVLFLLTAVTGVVLVFFGIKRHYEPIHELAERVSEKLTSAGDDRKPQVTAERKGMNELHQLEYAFERIFSEDLKHSPPAAEQSRHGIIDHFVSTWICGNIKNKIAFDNICRNAELDLSLHYYTAFGVTLHLDSESGLLPDYEGLYHGIRELFEKEGAVVLVKDLLFDHKLLLVINSDEKDPKYFYSLAEGLSDLLKTGPVIGVSVGIGGTYDSYDQMGRSYLDSVNALDYSIIFGRNCIITQGMCRNDFARSNYPSAELNTLSTAIFTRNPEEAFASMDRLKAYISSAECDLHSAKYICYDMFAALKRLPDPTQLYNGEDSRGVNYTGLTDFETIDEYFDHYRDLLRTKLEAISGASEPSSRLTGAEILAYVEQNFCDYSFQVGSMAEHFHISPQNMRKIFREYSGSGITEYVTSLRINKAMELLKTTDLDIQTITESIGLSDVSGFIRMFKQKTGMTPGQYRKF